MKKLLVALFSLFFFTINFSPALAVSKRIEVNLNTQHLYAYEDDKVVYNFPISSGKWNRTPTGTFYPAVKLPLTRMSGGNKSLGTYYNLPNVPHVIYYGNSQIPASAGYSLHGAYWHNNFGTPMSHGCINEPLANAKQIYDWIEFSTPIIVYGKAPI